MAERARASLALTAEVIGGGWTYIRPGAPCALAGLVEVPWDLTDEPHVLIVELLTSDGHLVTAADPMGEQQPIAVELTLEAGRPPGSARGAAQHLPVALNMPSLQVPPGRYVWRARAGEDELTQVPFEVVASPGVAA